jgi:methionine biosynthesis protein MetW
VDPVTPTGTISVAPPRQQGHYDEVWGRKGDGVADDGIRPGTRLDLAARLVGEGGRLVDIGCGNGAFCRRVRGRFRLIAGLEFSIVAASMAAAAGARVVAADLDHAPLPLRDAAVDVVTCLDVIEHVLDPRRLLRETARVLRPGGRAIVTTPNIQFWRHIWSIVRGRFPRTSTDPEGYDGGHLHYFTFRDLEALAEEAGLEVVHRQGIINAPRYGLKNRALAALLGDRFVREFRTFGILLILRRPSDP